MRRMPHFGLSRLRGAALGQFNANAYLVPGTYYQFNFTVQVSQSESLTAGIGTSFENLIGSVIQAAPSAADFENTLNAWQPFSGGTLTLEDVNLSGSQLSVAVLANQGSQTLTQGGVEAAIADTLNSAGGFGYQLTVTPADAPGLGTTTPEEQYQQTPTPSVVDTIKALLGVGPALPAATNPSAPWWLYLAGAGLIGFVVYDQYFK